MSYVKTLIYIFYIIASMQVIYFRQLCRHVHSNQQNSAEWHHVTPHCLAPLEKICSSLGITLSQFFQEEDSVYLIPDQK